MCANLQILAQNSLFFYCLAKDPSKTVAVVACLNDKTMDSVIRFEEVDAPF
jgi:hypothetical protein